MLTAVGAQVGILRGLPSLFGVMIGMGLMMFVVPFGLGSLVLKQPVLLWALKGGGAAFLLWLSWRIATSSGRIDSLPDSGPVGFLGAAVFQWVNPKSWLISAAAGTFLSAKAGSAVVQAVFLGGLFVLAALPSCFLWLAFGAAVQPHLLRSARRMRVFNASMGVLLALSIVLILR